jgi:hypothetical protein
MNKKIGVYGSVVNFIAVICFAISMLFGFDYGSYLSSMFIAFSFVLMMCGYAYFAEKGAKLASYVSVAFSAIYAVIVLLVYFTQLTTVRLNELTQQAALLLDFQQCGLMFNYDLLGYAAMSVATFFCRTDDNINNKSRPMVKTFAYDTWGIFHILSDCSDTWIVQSE